MAISVIVCTHDRPHYLEACLAGIARQRDAPAFETIVVDSASPPAGAGAIAALAARHAARLLRTDRPGLSRARNLGAAEARGRWLAYIDDDAVPDTDWLAAIARAGAATPQPAALGGKILPAFESPLPAWWPPQLVGALTVLTHDAPGVVGESLPRDVELYGANFIVRAEALATVGGFPEGLGRIGTRLLSNEESLVLRRFAAGGLRIAYDPAIRVTHSIQAARLTPAWLLSRQYWQGVSASRLAALTGERRKIWAAAPRLLTIGLVFGPLLLLARSSPALLRQRCKAAYAWGVLRGLLAGKTVSSAG